MATRFHRRSIRIPYLPTERTVTSPCRRGRPSLDLVVGLMKCHRLCLQRWHTSRSTAPPTVCRWWPQTCFPGVPPGDKGPGLTGGLPGVLGVTGLKVRRKKGRKKVKMLGRNPSLLYLLIPGSRPQHLAVLDLLL